MKPFLILSITIAAIVPIRGQTQLAGQQTRLQSFRQQALAAFRDGDAAAAKAAIAEAVATRRASGEDDDVSSAEELASLSFSLADVNDPADARELAAQSAVVLKRLARGRDRDAVLRAALLAAHLQERILHDFASARTAYQRALELDPANAAAKEGVARIDLDHAVVAEKIKEQQLLQERAK
jgi:hypothetical protein